MMFPLPFSSLQKTAFGAVFLVAFSFTACHSRQRPTYENGGSQATSAQNQLDLSDSNNKNLGTDSGAESGSVARTSDYQSAGGARSDAPAVLNSNPDQPQNPTTKADSR